MNGRISSAGPALALAAALILSGCGSDDSASTGAGSGAGDQAAVADQGGLGCSTREWSGDDRCTITTPASLPDGAGIYLWVDPADGAGEASSAIQIPGQPEGLYSCGGSGLCTVVAPAVAGAEIECVVSGAAGAWGCSLQPGGPPLPEGLFPDPGTAPGATAGEAPPPTPPAPPTMPPAGGSGQSPPPPPPPEPVEPVEPIDPGY